MSKIGHNSAIMFFAFTGVLAPHRGQHDAETPERFGRPTQWDPRSLGQGAGDAPVATDDRGQDRALDCGSVWVGALPRVDRG
jgi:hypothetical protein